MNDSELSRALGGLVADRKRLGAPATLHEKVWAISTTTRPEPHWLPRLDAGRFQSMFSATKFVAAGAIVALFGGFLLAGVLTQPSDDRLTAVGASAPATTQTEPTDVSTSEPEPTADEPADTATTPDLIPGVDLVAEEVEPGVLRVLSDGVRDLTQERTARIVHGQDGSVWLFRDKEFFRLGDADTHAWPNDTKRDLRKVNLWGPNIQDIEVGPDGVVWWADRDGKGLWSFDGQAWTLRRKRPAGGDAKLDEVEVLPDGTVLASWRGDAERGGAVRKLARLGPDGWEVLAEVDQPNGQAVLHADDMDDIRLVLQRGLDRIPSRLFRGRFPEGAEGELRRVELPPETISAVQPVDGTVVAHSLGDLGGRILVMDGTNWTERSGPDGLPESGFVIDVTPDGSLWYGASCEARFDGSGEGYLHGCALVYSDGRYSSRFELGDTSGFATAVAPDGTLWLLMDAEQGGLYVITPEAVLGDSLHEEALMSP